MDTNRLFFHLQELKQALKGRGFGTWTPEAHIEEIERELEALRVEPSPVEEIEQLRHEIRQLEDDLEDQEFEIHQLMDTNEALRNELEALLNG